MKYINFNDRNHRLSLLLEFVSTSVPAYQGLRRVAFSDYPLVSKKTYLKKYHDYLAHMGCSKEVSENLIDKCISLRNIMSGEQEIKCDGLVFERSSGTTGPSIWLPRTNREFMELSFSVIRERRRLFPLYDPKQIFDSSTWLIGNRLDTEDKTLKHMTEHFRTSGKSWIYGRVSVLTKWADFLNSRNENIDASYVETCGEFLDFSREEKIKESFAGSTIVNQYGCRESWVIGYSKSTENRFFLNPDVITEIIDSTGNIITSPWEYGKIVVTSLILKTFPIIRFVTGDYGCWLDGERGSLCLQNERIASALTLSSGDKVSGAHLLKALPQRIFEKYRIDILGNWKVRRCGNIFTVFLEEIDMCNYEKILELFRAQVWFREPMTVVAQSWKGWQIGDKEILYIEE